MAETGIAITFEEIARCGYVPKFFFVSWGGVSTPDLIPAAAGIGYVITTFNINNQGAGSMDVDLRETTTILQKFRLAAATNFHMVAPGGAGKAALAGSTLFHIAPGQALNLNVTSAIAGSAYCVAYEVPSTK